MPTKPQLEFWSDTFYKIRLKLCPISLLSHFMSFYCNKNCSNGGKLVVWANSILEYCVDTNDVDDSTWLEALKVNIISSRAVDLHLSAFFEIIIILLLYNARKPHNFLLSIESILDFKITIRCNYIRHGYFIVIYILI